MEIAVLLKKTIRQAAAFLTFHLLNLPFFGTYRAFLWSKWVDANKGSKVDALAFDFYLHHWLIRYYAEPNPEVRVSMQNAVMGGDTGVKWAAIYFERPFPPPPHEKVGDLSFDEAFPLYQRLHRILSAESAPCDVIQIGSSSGRNIAWLAKQFPNHNFLGTDIYDEVEAFQRANHSLPNLSFATVPVTCIHLLMELVGGRHFIFFADGSMQYVQPEHLDRFFKLCVKPSNKVEVHLVDAYRGTGGGLSAPRANLAYSHDYAAYAAKHGYPQVYKNIIDVAPGNPYLPNHYDFYCKNFN